MLARGSEASQTIHKCGHLQSGQHQWWSLISRCPCPSPTPCKLNINQSIWQLLMSLGIKHCCIYVYTINTPNICIYHKHTHIYFQWSEISKLSAWNKNKKKQCITHFQRGADALDPIREEVMPGRYKWNPATCRLSLWHQHRLSNYLTFFCFWCQDPCASPRLDNRTCVWFNLTFKRMNSHFPTCF